MKDTMETMWRSVRDLQANRIPPTLAGTAVPAPYFPASVVPPASLVPDDANPGSAPLRAAETAMAASDWHVAIEAWDVVGRHRPNDPSSFLGRASAWRALDRPADAELVLQDYLAHNPVTAEVAVSRALNSQQQTDWEQALGRWQQAREQFPEVPVIWASEAAMLQILARFGEADDLITEALNRFPGSVDVAAQYHNIALARQDWPEARRRWENFETYFSGHSYIRADGDDVKRRIADGLATMDWQQLRAQAAEADANKHWVRSAELWRLLHDRNGEDATAILGYGRALRESSRHEAADRILRHGSELFPDNVEILANHAEVAAAKGDWDEAAQRWKRLLQDQPDIPALWLMGAVAHGEAGLFETAEALLGRAIEAEPERVDLRVHHAKLAERQQDWSVAAKRWDIAHRMKPDDLNIQNSRGDAIWEETAKLLENGERPDRVVSRASLKGASAEEGEVVEVDAAALKQLALGFEGLGDNCEFGIVQRRLGAEPIGLFRFAAISAATLIDLTREAFVRLGDPDYIELRLTGGDEFLVTDTRGLYHMHSFVRKGSVDEAKFLRQQITRLGYLKKKLIEDLQEADKIFVFKSSEDRLTDEMIRDMHSALSKFGDITLLVIRKTEDGHAKGSVEVLSDRILVGYVETLYNGEGNPIDFEAWRSILGQSYRHKAELDRHRAEYG